MTIGPYKTPAKLQDQGYTTSLTIKTQMDQINKDKKKERCIYCKGEHWIDDYLRYLNIEVR